MSTTATPAAPAAPAPQGTGGRRATASRRRPGRGPVVVVVLLLVGALALAWMSSSGRRGHLDAAAYDASGSRAVAELVRDAGVPVEQVRALDDAVAQARGRTLVVTIPDLLEPDDAERLAASGAATVVVVAPQRPDVLAGFVPGVEPVRAVDLRELEPACDLRAAVLAGSADAGGTTYRVDPGVAGPAVRDGADRCYPVGGDPSLVVVPADAERARTVVVGSPRPFQNGWVDEHGNAALAINLLGAHEEGVVWYLPRLGDLVDQAEEETLTDLLPDAVVWATVWLGVVVLLLAAWRGRRLGPLVSEELPVVVRSAETTEGRARLYRRARARGHAAELLRAATRERLASALGAGPSPAPAAVVSLVSARTPRDPAGVAALLYGAAPPDDAALVRLADDLDRLEREVRRP